MKRTISTFDLLNLKSENKRLKKENEKLKLKLRNYKQYTPIEGEPYFYVDDTGTIQSTMWTDDMIDLLNYNIGNVFIDNLIPGDVVKNIAYEMSWKYKEDLEKDIE